VSVQKAAIDIQKQLAQLEGKIQSSIVTLRRTKLTLSEISTYPNNTNSYKTVGRVFIKTSLKDLKEDLKVVSKDCETSLETCKAQKTRLEQELEQAVLHLKELSKSHTHN